MRRAMPWINAALSIGAGWAVCYFMGGTSASDLRSIASTFAGIAGTLLGFMIAALSILTAVMDRRLVANLRKTGHYDRLLHELYMASAMYLVALVLSLVTLFLGPRAILYGTVLTVASMVSATVLFVSSGRKFALVMKYLQ